MIHSDTQAFKKAFARLNTKQRQAVEQTDGPLMVVAGPGTGKTQLLSARVAYIMQATDTLPNNILCLTFTESGAQNMRERLSSFIGQAAYDVTIGTYHAFGGDLIKRFPQYFGEHRDQQPADGLAQHEVASAIVGALPFNNPIKSTQYNLRDLLSTISEVKRGLLNEDNLRAIALDNMTFLEQANSQVAEIFADLTRMPGKLDKALPYFTNLYGYLSQRDQEDYTIGTNIKPLANTVIHELSLAINEAEASNSSKPLTAWKNQWLEKDGNNNYIFAGQRESLRIAALADVFQKYKEMLAERALYDFDDMILRSITALEQNDDLRFTLQEQYQYIMLDEFQDTNAAQLKLIKLLTNNPVAEGRPNVMAVGDDDQAIYAFQGAEVSNMLEFVEMYRDTAVINLTDNYRSHGDILHVAHQVAAQIDTRLESTVPGLNKTLDAANTSLTGSAHIDRHEFQADVGQYDWIAQQIADLIQSGVPAQEIAVLAPRHKQLEPLVPFLNRLEIPVRYEKRENILEAPVVQQLLQMARLVLALRDGQQGIADALWPEVLSYNFWQLPTSTIWQLSWKVSKERDEGFGWSQAVLDPEAGEALRRPGLLILTLAKQATSETLEVMMDCLIGNQQVATNEPDMSHVRSPLKEFYMGQEQRTEGPDLFYQTVSHLTCLREKLRDHQDSVGGEPLRLDGLINLVNLYQAAGERMLNTSPYNQHAEAVQLMTVFKAKGLEFEHVFLPSMQDDVWGNSSRGSSNHLKLPANLQVIRPAGTTEDERLRIFFVAVTRAKLGLHLTSFMQTYSGRNTKRLKYLNEQPEGEGFKTLILPAERQDVRRIDREVPELSTLELNWRQRHFEALNDTNGEGSGSSLRSLLQDKLQDFKLSPTQFCAFTDTIYGGPQEFLFSSLLRFPYAPHPDADFGTAIHETLQWVQQQVDQHDALPVRDKTMEYYRMRLARRHMRTDQHELYAERGVRALDAYIAARNQLFRRGNKAEVGFRNENVIVGEARLSGRIDFMEIDQQNRTITVVDYKTGQPHERWTADPKLYKYRRQLISYKLLIENSRTYKGYKVNTGRLEYVEPDENGRIITLPMEFDNKEVEQTKQLLAAIWKRIQDLDFPDISEFDQTLSGIKAFEASLLEHE